jgi:hypothetical protein
METKYIIRISVLLTAALVFSVFSVYRGSSGAYINDNKITTNKNIPPYISVFHNVGGFFNAELHGRSQASINDAIAASTTIPTTTTATTAVAASTTLPATTAVAASTTTPTTTTATTTLAASTTTPTTTTATTTLAAFTTPPTTTTATTTLAAFTTTPTTTTATTAISASTTTSATTAVAGSTNTAATIPVNLVTKDTVNNTKIPAEIISGVINDETIWNAKIGPFRDASYVQELTRYLLSNGFKVLLKADISEAGYDFIVFLNPTTNRSDAEQTITNLSSKCHIAATVTKNYS